MLAARPPPEQHTQKERTEEPEHAEMQRKLLSRANALMEFVTIDAAVAGQIDCTRKKVKELSKVCEQEYEKILELNRLTKEEEEKEDEKKGEGSDGVDMVTVIRTLEGELRALYEQRADLVAKRRKH